MTTEQNISGIMVEYINVQTGVTELCTSYNKAQVEAWIEQEIGSNNYSGIHDWIAWVFKCYFYTSTKELATARKHFANNQTTPLIFNFGDGKKFIKKFTFQSNKQALEGD